MDYLGVFIAVCAVIATIRKDIYGICCFMAVRILIPESTRFVTNSLSLNTVIILCVLIVIILKHIKSKNITLNVRSYPMVLILLVLYFAVTLPFSDVGDLASQYSRLLQFIITDVIPPVILFSCLKKDENVVIFVKAYMLISLVCCVYGILVIGMQGMNPYVTLWTGDSTYMETWKGVSTSATFVSNNTFGYYLTMSFPFCFYIYNVYYKKNWVRLLLILQIICILFTKKRSAFICLVAFIFMYFVKHLSKRKLKTLLLGLGLIALGVISIFIFPQFASVKNFIVSSLFFWNDTAVAGLTSAELGSSWSLRITQVTYPYTEIENNLLFGHGFGWCSWYLDNFKLHWPLYGFETIFSSGICEFGILGYVVYFVIFYSGYKYTKCPKIIKDNYPLLFIMTVIIMAVATGFNYYYLYFSLIVVMNSLRRQLNNEFSRELEISKIWSQKFLLF